MNIVSNICFPFAVIALTTVLSSSPMHRGPSQAEDPVHISVIDTVVYPSDAYKVARIGEMPDEKIPDSILVKAGLSVKTTVDSLDTLDTIVPLTPEELAKQKADSLLRAQIHYKDSVRLVKEEKKEKKDSIFNSKPRILETFALPETLQYKRIIQWNVDQDFHDLKVEEIDTSFNYHYYDYPFQRNCVNAVWLGVSGAPTMDYNYFRREDRDEGVEFYKTQESWSFSPSTFVQYNSKTPHTELAYYGTLLAGDDKESDNVHIFTTQNILPELNVSFLFERFGSGGILVNEETKNRDMAIGVNYLGKKYMANFGYIRNKVIRGENWGITDISEVRDTILEPREIKVNNTTALSRITKNTVFLDQQFRIAFNFLQKKEAADTAQLDSLALSDVAKEPEGPVIDTVNRDITSAYIGHSSEFSSYSRAYVDQSTTDTMSVSRLDNKVFLRLQPWASDGVISKIDVGVGDKLMNYKYGILRSHEYTNTATENTFYLYAGARGQFKKYINWDAKFHYNMLGARAGDFDIKAGLGFNFYPFRKDRNSPVAFRADFTQILEQPNFYQQHFLSSLYSWDNDFNQTSSTKIEGSLAIPRWRFNASVGYALLNNNIYYDANGIVRQNSDAMSILTASLREEFVIAKFLHLDNKVLFQMSSNQDVVPLPALSLNLRYFAEFVLKKHPIDRTPVLTMQIGVNAFYNSSWLSPRWNPVTGTFYNQDQNWYNNGPYFDAFINMQWKRACIFVKLENAGQGWPARPYDYFASDSYIVTRRMLKFGLFWPFYIQPKQNKQVSVEKGR